MKMLVIMLTTVLLASGCTQQPAITGDQDESGRESVSFQTEDGVTILGNYWEGSDAAVLLLHMMPATKESWNEFTELLNQEGFSVLAIDLRGHGESVQQGTIRLDYLQFTDEQHQASIKDMEAAGDYLREQGARTIYLGGASIGANLALQYQAAHPEVMKAILLSAGINYRGIETEPLAQQLHDDQQVFLAAGTLDGPSGASAAAAATTLADLIAGPTVVKIYETSSHGTDLFTADPELMSELVEWLKREIG